MKKIYLAIVFALIAVMPKAQNITPKFTDVSKSVGLSQIKANKYWSPVVADFNRDGYYDLILCNHGAKIAKGAKYTSPEMYWGTETGFEPFEYRKDKNKQIPPGGIDFHGFSAGYFGNKDDYPDLILTVGGSNGGRGNLPTAVEFVGAKDDYIVRRDLNRKDALVHKSLLELGLDGFGRGRSCYFIDMDQDGDLDLVYNNKGPNPAKAEPKNITDSKFIYKWEGDKFQRVENIGALKDCTLERAAMVDINHDGLIDLVYFTPSETIECWISQGPGFDYKLDNSFLPKEIKNVGAIAEIDYDADGDFDLYLARTTYDKGENDILLEWDETKNKYIDVTKQANLPIGGQHQGVSVGDFDNDGYQDVFLGVSNDKEERLPDLILMNKGDKTFEIVKTHGAVVLDAGEKGDQSEVFDFNGDGKLDILSGSKWGLWRMFKNETNNPDGNYITVQVGRSNSKDKLPPLGAVVTVTAKKGKVTLVAKRRIGSQGQSFSQSFLDKMHFGLGAFDTISEIKVEYGTYSETTKFKGSKGKVNRVVTVGQFPTIAK